VRHQLAAGDRDDSLVHLAIGRDRRRREPFRGARRPADSQIVGVRVAARRSAVSRRRMAGDTAHARRGWEEYAPDGTPFPQSPVEYRSARSRICG
jgi:hypothetical protein